MTRDDFAKHIMSKWKTKIKKEGCGVIKQCFKEDEESCNICCVYNTKKDNFFIDELYNMYIETEGNKDLKDFKNCDVDNFTERNIGE
jgi:hypothetical protein